MRVLAWLLAAYAVAGTIFIGAALVVGAPAVNRVDRLTTSALATLNAASDAADAAADAFGGFDTSLVEARSSATDAASLSRQTSATLEALAANMSISIFGAQPLLPLAEQFRQSADQLQLMGDNLDGIGEALTTNRDDVARVGTRMRALADQLDVLQGRLEAEQGASQPPISLFFYGFLAWQVLPIAAAAVGSAYLFRHTRVVVVDEHGRPEPIDGEL